MPQPMTAAGVASKMTELYALSNTLLFAQADAIESDFRGWIRSNFSLTAPQNTYLSGIDDDAGKYYGSQCSMAFRARLSVSLSVAVDPIPPSPKWVKSESTLKVSTNASGALEGTGSLIFKFEYRT